MILCHDTEPCAASAERNSARCHPHILDLPIVVQAAVSAAAAAVLRCHVALSQDVEAAAAAFPEREARQVLSDCVRALCQWRDDVARHGDEGTA